MDITEKQLKEARLEIQQTLTLCTFCTKRIGLSFDEPKTKIEYISNKCLLYASVIAISVHLITDLINLGVSLSDNPQVVDIVPMFHLFGYGALSIAKLFTLWHKKDLYRDLLEELARIWPKPPLSEATQADKENSFAALNIVHRWYFGVSVVGVWFFNLTPISVYLFKLLIKDQDATVGFIWITWYPFDKYQTVNHVFVYFFEMFIGVTCVWIMVGTDLLFITMTSHIGFLLRMLQRKLESIRCSDKTEEEQYQEIIGNIKLHQRMISYCNDLEQSFSMVNMINILMSSVNICCVVFVIVLLEPLLVINNKLFLISTLIQVGMLCWYADEIYHANANIAVSSWNNEWYRTSPRCQHALMFMIQRAQKPIAFTAKGFTAITLKTYTSILTRSYSYFTLLYTMYKPNS